MKFIKINSLPYHEICVTEDIELGQLLETEVNFEIIKGWVYTPVYATKKSVKSSEHYQAATVGLKPELVFIVRDFEYNNHERLKYKSKIYEVVRTYHDDEVYELTVTSYTGVEV